MTPSVVRKNNNIEAHVWERLAKLRIAKLRINGYSKRKV